MRSRLWTVLLFFFVVSSAWAAPETVISNIDPNEFCGPASSIRHLLQTRACHHDPSKICDCDQDHCDSLAMTDCGCVLKSPVESAQLRNELQGASVLYWWRSAITLPSLDSTSQVFHSVCQRPSSRCAPPHAPPPRAGR